MPEKISENDVEKIVIGPVQTLRTIDESMDMLSRCLCYGAGVVADCSGVEDADISFVQVLLAGRVTAERLGTVFRLERPSLALLGVLERAGVPNDPFWSGGQA